MSYPTSEPLLAIPDFVAKVHELILEAYKNPREDNSKGNLESLLEVFASECQNLEEMWQELLVMLDMDAAVGAWLDILGRIACVAREGRSDDQYRVEIKLAFTSNFSGTPDQILQYVKRVTNSDTVAFIAEYPANFWITCDGDGLTAAMLARLAPAGVLGLPGCLLGDADDDIIVTASGEPILVVGPCPAEKFPYDREWDAGMDVADPSTLVLSSKWPFRDGTGVAQQPDAGMDAVPPEDSYTFDDGTYAEN